MKSCTNSSLQLQLAGGRATEADECCLELSHMYFIKNSFKRWPWGDVRSVKLGLKRDRPCGSFGEARHSFALAWQAEEADDLWSSLKDVHWLWLLP